MATGNPAIQAAINQMIAAQSAPVVNAQKRYDANAQQQTTNIQGLTQALASILSGIAPGIQQTYSNAATNQAGFAKGFSDELQAQLGKNADSTSSFLQTIGAPQSQVDQVRGQVAPAGARDTLYGLQGFIPASTLNREGAAFTAAAKQLPGIASTQGLQQIAKVQAAQRDEQSKTSDKLAELAGTIPKLRSDLETKAFDQAYKTHNANLADAKFGLQQQMDTFNQKYKIAGLNLRGQSLQLQAQKFARQTLQSDRSYQIALAGLGLRKASDQRAAIAAEYKLQNGGYSVAQINKFQSILQQGVDKITVGKDANGQATYVATDPDPKNKTGWKKVGKLWERPVTYGDYITQAVAHGAPLSLAIGRANTLWTDPLQRGTANSLSKLLGVSTADITGAAGLPTAQDYNSLTGVSGVKATTGVIVAAQSFLGVPYKWGGNNPKTGLDCSSFIQQTFAKLGVKLPRTTYAQVKQGSPVDLNSLQAGDVIFTRPGKAGPQHVGLYIGGGQVQESPHTGDVNKIIDLQSYLSDGFVAARRYLGNG